MLVEVDWHLDKSCKIERDEGYAWDVLSEQELPKYKTKKYNANIIEGTISDKFTLTPNVNIPQVGIEVSSGFNTQMKAQIEIEGIEVVAFENSFFAF